VLSFFKVKEEKKISTENLLSVKEKEILTHLVDGLSYKMVADNKRSATTP